eukprot:g6173.t1
MAEDACVSMPCSPADPRAPPSRQSSYCDESDAGFVTDLYTGTSELRSVWGCVGQETADAVFLNLYDVQLGSTGLFGFGLLNSVLARYFAPAPAAAETATSADGKIPPAARAPAAAASSEVANAEVVVVPSAEEAPIGVYHVGIELFGQEWQFGYRSSGCGILCLKPRVSRQHVYVRSLLLGRSRLADKKQVVARVREELEAEWLGREYDTRKKNCVDFARAFCGVVGVEHRLGPLSEYARWWPFSAAIS